MHVGRNCGREIAACEAFLREDFVEESAPPPPSSAGAVMFV
jgi:hypothetical protein